MSSPNINNVLLIGCILTYITVFMITADQKLAPIFCKVNVCCICIQTFLNYEQHISNRVGNC